MHWRRRVRTIPNSVLTRLQYVPFISCILALPLTVKSRRYYRDTEAIIPVLSAFIHQITRLRKPSDRSAPPRPYDLRLIQIWRISDSSKRSIIISCLQCAPVITDQLSSDHPMLFYAGWPLPIFPLCPANILTHDEYWTYTVSWEEACLRST